MPDYWPSCGYRLLRVTAARRLAVTQEFLRSYLLRPELAPVAESGAAEFRLYQRLLEDPRGAVAPEEIAAVDDDDAQENYRIWLRFRDRLVEAPDLESAYAALFRGEGVD